MAKMLISKMWLQPHHYLGCAYPANGPVQQKLGSHPPSLARPYSKSVTSCYDTLHVTPDSTPSQIKAAYYRLSKTYHPDVNKTKEAPQKFAEIAEAYEILGNKKNRSQYDQSLRRTPTNEGIGRNVNDNEFNPRTFKQRTGAVYGRTRFYDYDEFYRQHYGEKLKETVESRQAYKAYNEQRETLARDMRNRHIFAYSIVAAILGLFLGKKFRK